VRAAFSAAGGVRRALRAAWWYLREITGDADYDRYVAHHTHRHPGAEPLSRAAFQRLRWSEAERNPTTRCC